MDDYSDKNIDYSDDHTDDEKTGRNGEKGSFEVTKLGRWEKGRIMSNDKLQMSNQCQITKAKILLIWSDTAKFNRSDTAKYTRSDTTKYTRSDTTCGVNDRTSAVNPVSQPINETEFIFRYLGI